MVESEVISQILIWIVFLLSSLSTWDTYKNRPESKRLRLCALVDWWICIYSAVWLILSYTS